MSFWRNGEYERAEYACDFRTEASKAEPKNGQTIVSHTSHAEVQAPEWVKTLVQIRCGDDAE